VEAVPGRRPEPRKPADSPSGGAAGLISSHYCRSRLPRCAHPAATTNSPPISSRPSWTADATSASRGRRRRVPGLLRAAPVPTSRRNPTPAPRPATVPPVVKPGRCGLLPGSHGRVGQQPRFSRPVNAGAGGPGNGEGMSGPGTGPPGGGPPGTGGVGDGVGSGGPGAGSGGTGAGPPGSGGNGVCVASDARPAVQTSHRVLASAGAVMTWLYSPPPTGVVTRPVLPGPGPTESGVQCALEEVQFHGEQVGVVGEVGGPRCGRAAHQLRVIGRAQRWVAWFGSAGWRRHGRRGSSVGWSPGGPVARCPRPARPSASRPAALQPPQDAAYRGRSSSRRARSAASRPDSSSGGSPAMNAVRARSRSGAASSR